MINNFDGEYAFLSNFYSAPIRAWDALTYPTAEHCYQAMKFTEMEVRHKIAELRTPGQAKRYGMKTSGARSDWGIRRVGIMHEIVFRKFHQHPELLSLLLATQYEPIVEWNTWHDNFWGVCTCTDCREGQNMLGRILMLVRDTFLGGQ